MTPKQKLIQEISIVETEIKKAAGTPKHYVSVTDYRALTKRTLSGKRIWTKAFQEAISQNEAVYIPASPKPYYIDDTLIVPSNRTIRAEAGAVIRQTKGTRVLLLRNAHTKDGTHFQPDSKDKDTNITIIGGRWEESYRKRAGYGKSGMYDQDRSFFGVSTCMLFNNIENVYMTDVTFAHTAGFAVQVGQIRGAVFENIFFDNCYADGLHINGNTEDILIRNVQGKVGDDLVALNMYDWQNSSVNFGPMKNVLCEHLRLSEDSLYKAMRIEPGTYYFDDGQEIRCTAENILIKDVQGINTFKVYYQTPKYHIGTAPEKGAVGECNNIFFEDIAVDLKKPIDNLPVYANSDSVRGIFGAFELGANIEHIYFENIHAKLYTEKYPMSALIGVGPKSAPTVDGGEIFDPYLSSSVAHMHFKEITVNAQKVTNLQEFVKTSDFQDINHDGHSTGKGVVQQYINEDESLL